MALTVEVLKANSVLAGLSDEQLAAITTLSANDENSVIAQKTGKIYGACQFRVFGSDMSLEVLNFRLKRVVF